MANNMENFLETDSNPNEMILCRDFYYKELPPELSHMDKFDIAYADEQFESQYQELFPWVLDMMDMLLEGYTTFTVLPYLQLTDKEKKHRAKLIKKNPSYYNNIGFGKAYKLFLWAHGLPTEKVFANEYNISTITEGCNVPLLKAYFHSSEVVDFFWPKLYGFRDKSVIPPIHSEKELNDFLSLNKHDLYVYFHNYHAVFEVYFRKGLTTADELIERILPICEKHGKKLYNLL